MLINKAAKKMLDGIDNSKSYIEHDWQEALYKSIDFCMCIKLNEERIEKLMYTLMEENGVTRTYKEMDKDSLYVYPSEPYGICGELTVSNYDESSGTGTFIINAPGKGAVTYGGMNAKDYIEQTRNGGVYAAFVFTGGGAYKSRYYTYENSITNPNGDYRDF
ncbi:MAG: hypothetical protein PUE13_02770 [Clostridiales bacterium]|nr:hypothetical protein [Clostridiales bacterium]